jgi:nucleoside-diphosphate-sugar epimerase
MKKVLVTGATGALGKAVIAAIAGASARSSTTASRWQVFPCSRSAAVEATLSLDVRDPTRVNSVIRELKPDLVLHLAATLSDDFDEAFAVNVSGARNLCEAIAASGHPTRLLLAGSAAEYGEVQPEDNPLRTNHPLRPVSLYGMTKAWQSMLGMYYAQSGVDVVIARIFNLDGPGLSDRLFSGRIRNQLAAIRQGKQQRLNIGPLSAVRDYVSLETAARQIMAIAEQGRSGRVYHVGSGKGITMRELLRSYLAGEGQDFSIVDEASANSNRKGYDVPVIYADISETNALLALNDMAQAEAHAGAQREDQRC